MVVDRPAAERDDRALRALADVTRRDILAVVLVHDRSVSELARRYPMSFAAVQKHVAVLERAGLVTKHPHGREQRVRGNPDALRQARSLVDELEAVWLARLDRFADVLDDSNEGATR
jgi:DNA-binding transcriptional ArsR family regulator